MSGMYIRPNLHKYFPLIWYAIWLTSEKPCFYPILGPWLYKRAEYLLALCSLLHSRLIWHATWLLIEKNKRAHRPWIAHLKLCQEERMFTTKYKSNSPTLKCILGITRMITKAYQVTKFNQIILISTISMSDLFTQPKRSGLVWIKSNILIVKCDVQHSLLQKKKFWPFDPVQWSMVCKRAENLLEWCYMLRSNYLICIRSTFRK